MLTSYFQNMQVGMTKEAYFEMCEMLGNTPNEEEIPIEIEDLPNEVQEALNIYTRLKDDWDSFSGAYLGKNYSNLNILLDIFQVRQEEKQTIFDWILIIDRERSKVISQQTKPN